MLHSVERSQSSNTLYSPPRSVHRSVPAGSAPACSQLSSHSSMFPAMSKILSYGEVTPWQSTYAPGLAIGWMLIVGALHVACTNVLPYGYTVVPPLEHA